MAGGSELDATAGAIDDLGQALRRCAAGDRAALRAIFDSEGGRMVAVAQRYVARRDLAEDIVQDAFVQIWTKAHQYAPDRGSARGWIFAIVRNRALNLLRDSRRIDLLPQEEVDALRDRDDLEAYLDDWRRLEQGSRLHDCLSALEESRRRGILMAYLGGYTHGEIAGRLRVPLGTAKSWIRRGLASLRECMA